jgi:hypothetical protein
MALLPHGPNVYIRCVLPRSESPAVAHFLYLPEYSLDMWQVTEKELPVAVQSELESILASSYPNLLHKEPFEGRDGVVIQLGVGKDSTEPRDVVRESFRMSGSRPLDDESKQPAVRIVWSFLDLFMETFRRWNDECSDGQLRLLPS